MPNVVEIVKDTFTGEKKKFWIGAAVIVAGIALFSAYRNRSAPTPKGDTDTTEIDGYPEMSKAEVDEWRMSVKNLEDQYKKQLDDTNSQWDDKFKDAEHTWLDKLAQADEKNRQEQELLRQQLEQLKNRPPTYVYQYDTVYLPAPTPEPTPTPDPTPTPTPTPKPPKTDQPTKVEKPDRETRADKDMEEKIRKDHDIKNPWGR